MKTSLIISIVKSLIKHIAPCTIILYVISGCLSLDPFLFKEETVSEYKYDNYTGETECSDAIAFLNANNYALPIIEEKLITSGKETIYGVLLHGSLPITANDTIIIYFHGTSDHIDYYWPRTRLLFATGYPVLIIDYKGYGKSSGEPTEKGINEDGRSALNYLRDSLGNPSVIVYTYSLGSLVGCEVASTDIQNQIIQLILEAPIGSVETLVEDGSYLNLPGSYVTTFTGNNAERIKKVTVPLLWIHGTEDETLNRETNGKLVWDNHPQNIPGYYIRVVGAGHRTNPQTIGYEKYLQCLRDFIQDNQNKDPLLISK